MARVAVGLALAGIAMLAALPPASQAGMNLVYSGTVSFLEVESSWCSHNENPRVGRMVLSATQPIEGETLYAWNFLSTDPSLGACDVQRTCVSGPLLPVGSDAVCAQGPLFGYIELSPNTGDFHAIFDGPGLGVEYWYGELSPVV